MAVSFGYLAVIQKYCPMCGKLFTPELDRDIFCSMKCFFDFDDEAKAINSSYGWVLVQSKGRTQIWIPEQPVVEKRDWSD
jgi:hypothetical protein